MTSPSFDKSHHARRLTVFLVAVCGALSPTPVARAEDPIGSNTGPAVPFQGCRFFEDRNYGGHHIDVHANSDVSYIGDPWNDQISSLACANECQATIFEHKDFGGASVTWGAYTEYVGSFWNDKISSVKVLCTPPKPHGPFTGVPTAPMEPVKPHGPFTGIGPATPMQPVSDRCKNGFVWREARPSDHVCVPPETRDRTWRENSVANERIDPNGAWGPTSCISGFVWREAFEGDHVCVTPNIRDVVRQENELGPSRVDNGADTSGSNGNVHYSHLGKQSQLVDCPPPVVAEPGGFAGPAPTMTGVFDTDFGTLRLGARGGVYTFKDGQVCIAKVYANSMIGTWTQSDSGRRCDDGTFRGHFRFTFNQSGFTGSFGYCDDPPNDGPWNGRRK